jgi:hypothetical protein
MKKALCTSILVTVILSSPFLSSCKEHKGKKHKKKERSEEVVKGVDNPLATGSTAANCDTALWHYVYNPDRLEVIDYCKTVTGVIEESNADEDGDQHMLLKLDKGQDDLLTKRNFKKKQGDLVIEAVCVNKVMLKKVGSTCQGYINHIQIPRVGDHVRVSGSLVDDTHNGWNEIHPITKVEVIK